MQPTKSNRVLLVGDGAMAAEHARAFLAQENATVVGVVGEFAERAEEFADRFGLGIHGTDLTSVLDEAQPDVIVAAVSLPAIPRIYPALMNAEAVLLLEKPFGLEVRQAGELHTMAQLRLAPTFVAMNRRQYANMRLAREDLDGDPGRRLIQVLDQESFEHPLFKGYPADVVSKWPYANAIHLVDLLLFMGRGKVVSVSCEGWSGRSDGSQLVNARLEFDSGDVGSYEALWGVQGPWALAVTTTRTRWEMRPLEDARWKGPDEREWNVVEPAAVDLEFKPGLHRQAQQVLRAANGQSHSLVTPDVALASIQVLSQIYEGC